MAAISTSLGTVLSAIAAWRATTRARELDELRAELTRAAEREDQLKTDLSSARTLAALFRNMLDYPTWGRFHDELRRIDPWPPENREPQ